LQTHPSTFNIDRVDHLYVAPHDPSARLFLHYGDLANAEQITPLIYDIQPQEIYHLGAQSHVRVSFEMPEYTGDVTGLGTTRLLQAIHRSGLQTKFYQASSSEMFGAAPASQCEHTAFQPQSLYTVAKVYAYWMVEVPQSSPSPVRRSIWSCSPPCLPQYWMPG
jgi:GDPmannose 4,6-dehydratase